MKAAIVRGAGQAPVYGDFAEPHAEAGEALVTVSASALSHFTRGRAAGAHYSAANQFPFVAGVDGTGKLEDGTRVYFIMPRAPWGSMAEKTVVRAATCIPIPAGLDDVTAAAIVNPGMSSWVALAERVHLKNGETVLVNGATGIAGQLAVQVARHLGAGKVVATGRSEDALRTVKGLGADATIGLGTDEKALDEALAAQFAAGVDVVIDYLWGKSAERILAAASRASQPGRVIRFVQVGSSSGGEITLPSAVLRATGIELTGSGFGAIPPARMAAVFRGVLEAALPAGFKIATRAAPLSDVEQLWSADDNRRRTVFTI